MGTVNLADVLIAVSRSAPERAALKDDEECLSFGQMIDRAACIRAVLAGAGIGPGDRVGVAGHRDLENVVIYIALWLINAVAVPIDFRSRRGERSRHAETFQLKAIIESRTAAGEGDYPRILLDEAWRRGVAKAEPEYDRPDANDHPAFIALTSGTTGFPRGVVMSHESFYVKYLSHHSVMRNRKSGARYLNLFPLSFSAARVLCLFGLLDGATIQFHAPLFDTGDVLETIQRDGINSIFVVPQTAREMLSVAPSNGTLLTDMDFLITGGANLDTDLKRDLRRLVTPAFIESYAAATTGMISALQGEAVENRPETVGRLLRHVLAQTVDEDNRLLSAGATGRLRVRVPGMATEVIRGASDEVAVSGDEISGGWVYTGDIASLSADGFLTLKGRSSDMIIRSAVNIYPREIEEILMRHDGVQDVCVVAVPDVEHGEEVAAVIVGDGSVDAAALAALCVRELPSQKRPRIFRFVDSIPRSVQGKLVKSNIIQLAIGNTPAD